MNVNIDYLAAKYNNQINIGFVDCVVEKEICDSYSISTFPTIKYIVGDVIHDYYGRNSLRSLIELSDALICIFESKVAVVYV